MPSGGRPHADGGGCTVTRGELGREAGRELFLLEENHDLLLTSQERSARLEVGVVFPDADKPAPCSLLRSVKSFPLPARLPIWLAVRLGVAREAGGGTPSMPFISLSCGGEGNGDGKLGIYATGQGGSVTHIYTRRGARTYLFASRYTGRGARGWRRQAEHAFHLPVCFGGGEEGS